MTKLHSMRGPPHSQQEPVIVNIVMLTSGKKNMKEMEYMFKPMKLCLYIVM